METLIQPEILTKIEHSVIPQPTLPREVVVGAMKYAEKVRGTNHIIPHDQVESIICKLRGWN